MKSFLAALTIFLASVSQGDVPDEVLEWRTIDVMGYPGNDIILDCIRTADRTAFHAVVLNGDYSSRWRWYLVSFNRYGTETSRKLIAEDHDTLTDWLKPAFTNQGMLLLARGSRYGSGPASLTFIDPALPDTVAIVDLSRCFPRYLQIDVTSVVPLEEDGAFLVAGEGWFQEDSPVLFVAGVKQDGTVIWHNELYGHNDFILEATTVHSLDDGTIMLSFEEDGFPTGIPLYRLDSSGNEMWQTFIELNCEFTARCNDLLEMRNGDVLVAGCCDDIFSGGFRGILESFDPSLSSMWERADWYGDHTSFTSAQYTEEGEILVAGWTAEEGFLLYETEEMDVLLAFVTEDGSGIESYSVQESGDQVPKHVFTGGIGEYFVVGETDGDVFLGKVLIER